MERPNKFIVARDTLFVCRNGIARSQWAAEYWNRRFPGAAFAAGADVEARGQRVQDWDDPEMQKFVWIAISDGIDIARNERMPLDEATLHGIKRAIIMDLKAVEELEERRGSPLPLPDETEFWDNIPDPHHLSEEESDDIREIIKCRVGALATSASVIGGIGPGAGTRMYSSA